MFYKTKFPKHLFLSAISNNGKSKENCIIKCAGFGVVSLLHGG